MIIFNNLLLNNSINSFLLLIFELNMLFTFNVIFNLTSPFILKLFNCAQKNARYWHLKVFLHLLPKLLTF